MNRVTTALLLVLMTFVTGCIPDLASTHDSSVGVGVTIGGVARTETALVALSTTTRMANPSVEIVVGFLENSTTFVRLAQTKVVRDTADQHVALDVDIAPCLAGAPEANGCALVVAVRLIDGTGLPYDSATVGPLVAAKPGSTVEVPAIHFRPTAQVKALDSVMTVKVAQQLPARVNALDANGQLLVGRNFVWRSLNTSIATIDANGMVTGIVPGRATIEASREGITASFAVAVPIVETFVVTTPPVRVIATVPAQMNVTMTTAPGFANGVTYRSSNPAVATIDANGRIATLIAGSAVMTAVAVADTTARVSLAVTVDPFRAAVTYQRVITADQTALPGTVEAVWGTRSDSLVAVGCNFVSRYNGTSWTLDFKPAFCPFAITGTSMKSMWAIGQQIWHYDGVAWTRETVTLTGNLFAATTTADGTIFAVGEKGQILRRDASGWQAMASGTTRTLRAVSAMSSTSVYAVGDTATVLKLTNGVWTTLSLPTLVNFAAVRARSASEVYIAGSRGFPYEFRYYRFDGSNWIAMTTADGNGPGAFVEAGTDLYALGYNGMILRLSNGAWVLDNSIAIGTNLRAGFADAFGTVVVGGSGVSYAKRAGTWTPINHVPTYQAVWAASPNFIVAGGTRGAIDLFDGTKWTSIRGESKHDIFALWGTGAQNIWAAGGAGRILHYQGATWDSVTTGTTSTFMGMWGSARDTIWAVSDGGIIHRFNGTSWVNSFNAQIALRGVHGTSSRNVYVVGDGGRILHFDGQAWSVEASGTPSRIWSVYAADSANVFAVGDSLILRRTNGTWSNVTPANSNVFFHFITGSGPKDVYAIGCGFRAFRFDGSSWTAAETVGTTGCETSGQLFPGGGGVFGGQYRNIVIGVGPLGNKPGLPN